MCYNVFTMKIFETHCHYEDEKFIEDREEVIEDARLKGVEAFVNVGSDLVTSEKSVFLAETHRDFYAAVGIHPEYGYLCDEEAINKLRELAKSEKVVAIGEIGLDYYWDSCPKDKQMEAFKAQLDLAYGLDLPVIIHSRDAAEDTLTIMREYANRVKTAGRELRVVIHCYGYSPEIAKEYVKLGYYIGVGGVVTFKNARKLVESVEAVALDRIVVETDCPYMAPVPNRGKRNDSSNLTYVIEKIAELKGLEPLEVANATFDNAKRLYNLDI